MAKITMIAYMPYLNCTSQMTRENQEKFRIRGVPAGHKGLCEVGRAREEAEDCSRKVPLRVPDLPPKDDF